MTTAMRTLIEKKCEGCGIEYRLEVEIIAGPSAAPWYQHCENDKGEYIPGKLVALSELRDGNWVPV